MTGIGDNCYTGLLPYPGNILNFAGGAQNVLKRWHSSHHSQDFAQMRQGHFCNWLFG
jgi:hypothetical protein